MSTSRQGFCHQPGHMYSAREIARAAGVPAARVRAALSATTEFLCHREAVALGRRLVKEKRAHNDLFAVFEAPATPRPSGLPFALSSTVHAGVVAAVIFIFSFSPAP